MSDNTKKPRKEHRWTAIPAARSSAPVLKIRLMVVLGFLVLAALMGLFAGVSAIVNQPPEPEDPPPVPEALGFATEIADAWLTGRATTLPTAAGVDPNFGTLSTQERSSLGAEGPVAWDGFRVLTPFLGGTTYEVHRFVVGGTPPRQLVVTVALTPGGAVLAAAPALEALPVAAGEFAPMDYRDRDETLQLNADVQRIAQEWVRAYAADNRARLREITGDPEPRVYPGIGGGFSAGDVTVSSAYPAVQEGMWVVRVRTRLEGPNDFTGTAEWDLLVADPTTANPSVVAWGPPALGLYLEPFQNGIVTAAPAEDADTTDTTEDTEPAQDDAPEPRSEPES